MPAEWICSPPGLAASVKFIVNTATEDLEKSIALPDLSLEPLCFAPPRHSVIRLKKRDSFWIRQCKTERGAEEAVGTEGREGRKEGSRPEKLPGVIV